MGVGSFDRQKWSCNGTVSGFLPSVHIGLTVNAQFGRIYPSHLDKNYADVHCAKKPVTTMLTYPWKCTVLHWNHLGNTWKALVLMTRHFDYCPSASEGDNQSVRSSAPVVSRCFPGGSNVKLYISRGRLAWWLLAFLHSVISPGLWHLQ